MCILPFEQNFLDNAKEKLIMKRICRNYELLDILVHKTQFLIIIYIYRTIQGECNNLRQPFFGKAFTPFGRILDPAFEDGILEPR